MKVRIHKMVEHFPAERSKSCPEKHRILVAKRGDILSKIISQNYGDYSEDNL
jgi:hypothetical protein